MNYVEYKDKKKHRSKYPNGTTPYYKQQKQNENENTEIKEMTYDEYQRWLIVNNID